MWRTAFFTFATLLLVTATGCGNKNPPTSPEPSASAAPIETPPAPQKPAPAPPKEPTSAAPASTSSPLRDVVGRYLESDGQGGWRKNEKAATELEKLGPDQTAQLWPLLKDPHVEVRRGAAVFLLTQFDPRLSDHVAAFIGLLDDSDRMVRARALDAVRLSSRDDQVPLVPRLAAMLDPSREDRADNRVAIARLCGALRSSAAKALPALESSAASDPDTNVRSATLVAIAQIADPPQAATILAKSLRDREPPVRLVAAARLRQLGPVAAPATKELAATLADSNTPVAEAAAEALIRIGPPAVEPLAAQLTSSSVDARKLALACLAKLGPAAKPAAGQIEALKQDLDPQVRQLAEAALKRLAEK
jgi:HEAT repeat protein